MHRRTSKKVVDYCLEHNIKYKDPNEDEEIKRPIKNFKNVLMSWKVDGSPEHAQDMWQAFFGQFDQAKGWEFDLEQQFMIENGWKYLVLIEDVPSKHRKNCIARLIRQCKVNVVKRLNDATKHTHGRVIGVKRVNAKKQTDPDFKPRKLAHFEYDEFVKTQKVCILSLLRNIFVADTDIHVFRKDS